MHFHLHFFNETFTRSFFILCIFLFSISLSLSLSLTLSLSLCVLSAISHDQLVGVVAMNCLGLMKKKTSH